MNRREALLSGGASLVGLVGIQRVLRNGSVDVKELCRKAEALEAEFAAMHNGSVARLEPFQHMAEVLAMTARLAVDLKEAEL